MSQRDIERATKEGKFFRSGQKVDKKTKETLDREQEIERKRKEEERKKRGIHS